MFPFKKRNCVSVLRSMYFHTLHHYYDLIGLLAVLPVVLVVLALVTTVPCLSETARPPRYAADTLTSRPALKRRWCPIESWHNDSTYVGCGYYESITRHFVRTNDARLLQAFALGL